MSIESLLLESVALIIYLGNFIFILIANIKIYKIGNVSGSGKILIFLVGSILVTLLSTINFVFFQEEESFIFESILEIILSLCFAIGVYGFRELSKCLIAKNAKKE